VAANPKLTYISRSERASSCWSVFFRRSSLTRLLRARVRLLQTVALRARARPRGLRFSRGDVTRGHGRDHPAPRTTRARRDQPERCLEDTAARIVSPPSRHNPAFLPWGNLKWRSGINRQIGLHTRALERRSLQVQPNGEPFENSMAESFGTSQASIDRTNTGLRSK
jgi:hypothetical protein